MNPLSISGIGIISGRGRGLEKFESALSGKWVPPVLSGDGRRAYRIPAEELNSRAETLQRAKRADRFSKFTVLTALDAVKDSGLDLKDVQESTGIIIATALGSHGSVFKFQDGIIDYGEAKVSPTTFAHSIHNAAAAYVASVLETRGPVVTITQFNFALHQALFLAYSWLQEKRVKRVLVGIADEVSPGMEYVCGEKLAAAPEGKMDPLAFSKKPAHVPGEGCVFFLLSLDPAEAKYGFFSDIQFGKNARGWSDADLSILSANAMSGSEEKYRELLKDGTRAAAYSPLYGGMMTGGSFEAAAAALMLKKQLRYPNPVFDKMQPSAPEKLKAIQCVSLSCDGSFAFIKLTNT